VTFPQKTKTVLKSSNSFQNKNSKKQSPLGKKNAIKAMAK